MQSTEALGLRAEEYVRRIARSFPGDTVDYTARWVVGACDAVGYTAKAEVRVWIAAVVRSGAGAGVPFPPAVGAI